MACALQKLSVLENRLENGLLMHVCKERMIRNLKMKEEMEIKAKKRKRKRPESFWQQKYRSFVNKDLDWGGLYRDCSLHLKAVGDRPSVHDESGDVLLYFSNSMKTLSTLCLLDHKNEDKDIIKLKIIDRLEVIQDFKYCCNVKRYTDVKKRAMSHAVNAVPCVLHLHKRVMEKVMEMIYLASLNLHGDQTIAGRKRRIKEMEQHINTIAFGTVERPGKYTIPIKNKTAEIGEVKFNYDWAKRMEDKLMELLPLFFNKPECNIDESVICLKQMTLVLKK